MAEPRTPNTPLPRHTEPPPPARRTVLGVGVAAAAGLVLDVPAALASPTAAPARPPAPESDRHVLFRSYSGHELRSGTHDGTRAHHDGLRIAQPAGLRAYADPFGDGTAVTYDEASWTSPVIATPFPFNELIASWNAETPDQTWIEIEVRGTDASGAVSGWYVLGRWCANDPADGGAIHRTSLNGQRTDLANVWTDTLHVYDPHRLHDWQLRVTLLRPQGTTQTPVLRMVGAVASGLPSTASVQTSPGGRGRGRTLDVPTLSQEVHIGHYTNWNGGGEAWCSATSTAMVLRYWNTGPSSSDLAWVSPPVDAEVDFSARNVFDYTYDGAGNWPFNTAYAARYGLEGFVTRLRSLAEAEELIRAGIPVIISVSFEEEDLDGAGYGTNGHLMVVVGFTESGDVVVNDPASHLIADNGQVRTVYRRDQLENAWIPHSGGTAYVIRPRSTRLPQPLDRSEPNW